MQHVILAIALQLSLVLSYVIQGQLDLNTNLTARDFSRLSFKLQQISNPHDGAHSGDYVGEPKFLNAQGNFTLSIPDTQDSYYMLYSSSLDYNLKPNRVFITVEDNQVKAFVGKFGTELISSANFGNITLKEMSIEPLVISSVNMAPVRQYIQLRNSMAGGPLGDLLSSPWKLSLLITIVVALFVPSLLEKLDPQSFKEAKDAKLAAQQEQAVTVKAE